MKKRILAIILSMTLFVLSVVGVGAVDATNAEDTFSMVSMNFATGVETEATFELTDSELELIEEVVLSRKAPFDVTATPAINATASDVDGGISTYSIIDDDNRTRVADTESFPYCAIAYMEMVWMDGIMPRYTRGTAFLIDENTAVTAAHCIYDAEHGGWADSVAVFPAKKGVGFWNDPYGSCYATSSRIPGEWRSAADSGSAETDNAVLKQLAENDWAVLELETDMDVPTFLSMEVVSKGDIRAHTLKVSGYPGGDIAVPYAQYEADGEAWEIGDNAMTYFVDTYGGQSGAPIMILTENGYKVVGINTRGDEANEDNNYQAYNYGVRITDMVYKRILKLPLGE